jgi:hypothetical protein
MNKKDIQKSAAKGIKLFVIGAMGETEQVSPVKIERDIVLVLAAV